jgi:hypothetical protein
MRATMRVVLVALVLVMLSVPRAAHAVAGIYVNVDVTVGPSQTLVATMAFPVPNPTTATFTWNLTSEPPGLAYETMGLYDDQAHQPICPEDLVAGTTPPPCHCYPREPRSLAASGTETWVFDEGSFRCHTHFQGIKIRAANPTASYHVRGTLRLAFALQVPAAIKVSSPAAGAVIAVGSPFQVVWKALGQMASSVRIELIPDAEPQAKRVLIPSTPNDGSQSCTVRTLFPGTVKIRVVTTDNRVSGESGSFTIDLPAPPPR